MTRKREDLTQDELKEHLHYDPETGIFTRLKSICGVNVGDVAGCDNGQGYLKIRVLSFKYLAHRLAWLYMYNIFPNGVIDHINGISCDNRICNLRDVSIKENTQNRRKSKTTNTTGFLGVSAYPNGKYRSGLTVNGLSIYLGVFETAELAHQAYLEAKRIHHSTCTI